MLQSDVFKQCHHEVSVCDMNQPTHIFCFNSCFSAWGDNKQSFAESQCHTWQV